MRRFLQVSSRNHYGLRLMTQLAGVSGQQLSLKTIAEREHISLGYLEELARALRKHRLIVSARGAHGGYRLAKSAADITVAEVISAISGPLQIISCTTGNQTSFCPLQSRCPSRLVWQRLNEEINKTLASQTLADLKSN